MLHCGESPHPAHQGFADAIGADWYCLDTSPIQSGEGTIPIELLNGLYLDGYDIYIAEGTRALYGALINQIGANSTLIYLAADQVLYQLQNRSDTDRSWINKLISQFGMNLLEYAFNRYINGVITISDFAAGYTQEILETPIRIAHPYIQPAIYNQLEDISPPLGEDVAVTIGSYSWYKGQDVLPTVWENVRREHPTAELYLVGNGYPPHFDNYPGITVCGYVEKISDVLSTASIYVHPARAEAFGVSVIEALQAGVPAIVTTTTGAESAVRSVDESLIVDRSTESISRALINYFDQPIEDRRLLSQKSREQGSTFDSESRKAIFREEFNALLSEI